MKQAGLLYTDIFHVKITTPAPHPRGTAGTGREGQRREGTAEEEGASTQGGVC